MKMTPSRIATICARIVPEDQLENAIFPRNLEKAAHMLPFSVVGIEGLTASSINARLAEIGPLRVAESPYRLRGCVFCHGGSALIFLEANDPVDEQRFTLAHELAHFVAHYLLSRERALRRLGTTVQAVLDGVREPTPEERISGVLSHCAIGAYQHSMPGDYRGSASLEDEADQIAAETLAPIKDVAALIREIQGREDATSGVREKFGVPAWLAGARVKAAGRLLRPRHHSFLSSVTKAVRPD